VQGDREFALPELPPAWDGDGSAIGGPGLVRSLWRYRLVVAVVTALTAIAAYVVSLALPVRYQTEADLYLRDPGNPSILTLDLSTQSGGHDLFMARQAAIAGSDAVLARALQLLRRTGTPDDVRRSVEVAPSGNHASIAIRATAGSPAEAVSLANAVGTAYAQVAGENMTAQSKEVIRRLWRVRAVRESELDAVKAELADDRGPNAAALQRKALHVADLIGALQVHEDNVEAQAALYGNGVEMFQPATPPASSSGSMSRLLALCGAMLGLVGAGVWAWRKAGLDRRVDVEDDASAILGVPMLGEVPKLEATPGATDGSLQPPHGPGPAAAAEAYHFVLASLEHALRKAGGKVALVASATTGEGKTLTVLNLALAARQEGRKALLVDADERTRRLSELCRDRNHFDVVGASHDDRAPALAGGGSVLQVGPSERNGHHPAGFFRSAAFQELLTSSSGEGADLVLIDTPALLGVADAVTIADRADVILLVVNRGTALTDLRVARDRLRFTDTPLIGYVLNRGFAPGTYPAVSGPAAPNGVDWARRARSLLRRKGSTAGAPTDR
jgi:Mrp family chromosome partitioning ATPase/capsular polysaccharide biosynthesis protein